LTTLNVLALTISGTNLFAGTYYGGIFLSTNNGSSWTEVNSGLTTLNVLALAVSGTNLFAGTWGGGVFLSTDNGSNWTAIPMGWGNTIVHALAVSPTDSGMNLFAGTHGRGVFFSSNNGASWIQRALPNNYVFALEVIGTNLFIGTYPIVLTTNNGESWVKFNYGFPAAYAISFASNGTYLFAGTESRGIYRINISKMNDVSSILPLDPHDGKMRVLLDNSEQFPGSIELSWKYTQGSIIISDVRLQVTADSSFSTGITIDTIVTTSDAFKSGPAKVSGLQSGTTYYWRLALVHQDGSNSAWTDTWKFTTAGGVITGIVFDDIDRDGLRDDGEPGVPNWKLLVSGKCIGDIRTDTDGRFTFAGLDSGSYAVTSFVPDEYSMWTLTYPQTNLYSFTLHFDSVQQEIDFGWYYPWNSISGRVFEDVNENGRFDSITEHTLPGWSMMLAGYESRQLTTDEYGEFCFYQLWNKYYKVKLGTILPDWESIPSGYETMREFYFDYDGYNNHPDNANFAVHRIPARVKIELMITDNQRTQYARLRFGVRQDATYGIWRADSTCTITDYAEGEFELPPISGQVVDTRFVDPAIPSTQRFGMGSYTDIRSFYSEAQADTYRVLLQPGVLEGGDYPMTILWSKAAVEFSYSGQVFIRDAFMQETDMKQNDSLVIEDPSITVLRLIAMNPNMPKVEVAQNPITELPNSFQLAQNYPNPFNPTTTISYQLPTQSHVALKIFDVLGREVATLVNGLEEAGYKSVAWDARSVPSGVYFYRIVAGRYTETKKLLLLR
jgi:hypothetical protein